MLHDVAGSLVSGAFLLIAAGVGWLWQGGYKASQLDSLGLRVAALEKSLADRDAKIDAMSDNLARANAMLEMLVRRQPASQAA